MLILPRTLLEEVHRHARDAYPRECCGIFLGETSGDHWRATRAVRARNLVEHLRGDRYQMDPVDRFRAEQEARRAGLVVSGFYHSHPDHDVYFSQTDVENSEEYLLGEPWMPPTYAYLVVSIWNGEPRGQGAFLVLEGKSCPLELQIAES